MGHANQVQMDAKQEEDVSLIDQKWQQNVI